MGWRSAIAKNTECCNHGIAKAGLSYLHSSWRVFQLWSYEGKKFNNLLLKSDAACWVPTQLNRLLTSLPRTLLHKSMNQLISKAVDNNQHNWMEVLPYLTSVHWCTVHKSTGYSQNNSLYHWELYTPIDMVTQPLPADFKITDYV